MPFAEPPHNQAVILVDASDVEARQHAPPADLEAHLETLGVIDNVR